MQTAAAAAAARANDDTDEGGAGDNEHQDETAANGDAPNRTPPAPRARPVPKRRRDGNDNEGDRLNVLRNLNATFTRLAENQAGNEENRDVAWGNLYGQKVHDLNPAIREQFKLHCDRLWIKAVKGEWYPDFE